MIYNIRKSCKLSPKIAFLRYFTTFYQLEHTHTQYFMADYINDRLTSRSVRNPLPVTIFNSISTCMLNIL